MKYSSSVLLTAPLALLFLTIPLPAGGTPAFGYYPLPNGTVTFGPSGTGTGTAPFGTGTAPPGTGTAPPGTGTAPPGTGTAPPGTGTAPPGTGTGTASFGTGTLFPGTGSAPLPTYNGYGYGYFYNKRFPKLENGVYKD